MHPPEVPKIPLSEHDLLANLLGNTPDRIYFKDRESRFIKINDATARVHGLTRPEEAIGKTDFDFFGKEHAQAAYDDEQRVMSTGEPIVGKEELENWADGHLTWVSSTKVALRDSAGNIVGIMGISRDITARKRAETERDRLLGELQEAVEQIQTLSGLLPICAGCKKIRDDGGTWSEVETYVTRRSGASFSHGICPDCARKLYPDVPELQQ